MTTQHTKTFEKHASVVKEGVKYMSKQDFTLAVAPETDFYNIDKTKYGLLFDVADQDNKGLVSLKDYLDFQTLLAKPDAEFEVLFRLIDQKSAGVLTVDQFKTFWSSKSLDKYGTETIQLYLGSTSSQNLTYPQFAQLLKGLANERLVAEFKKRDSLGTGSISQADFKDLVLNLAGHRLSPSILDKIQSLYPGSAGSCTKVTAFMNVMRNLESIEKAVQIAAAESPKKNSVTRNALFKTFAESPLFDGFTPIEVDTIFNLVAPKGVSVSLEEGIDQQLFDKLFDPRFGMPVSSPVQEKERLSATMELLKSLYNFALGSVAGAIGATFVYPIDLVKTRMQNQRSKVVGQLLYKNSWDCFKKVLKNEGAKGLYSGLLPQLVGVAPEKAIKLTMNDLMRSRLKDPQTGKIHISGEILAGCTAGGSQVLFTNPLEIVKIRLQVQGEVAKSAADGAAVPRQSAISIVRQLGLLGLYKGVGACLLRDIPFSGIYFPVYSHLKSDLFNEGKQGKKLSIPELLMAGALAGMPAAYLVTPADVIKTRLQVQARKGETSYNGIRDAFVKILKEEGPRAFYKGGVARVMRSSPQFGVTLASYEFLHSILPVDFGEHKVTETVPVKLSREEIGKRNVMRLVHDLSSDLFPKSV